MQSDHALLRLSFFHPWLFIRTFAVKREFVIPSAVTQQKGRSRSFPAQSEMRMLLRAPDIIPNETAHARPQLLYGDSCAIKLRECESREGLVIGVFLISQNADGHGLPQQYRLCGIRAPVQTRNVACLGNIVGEFVQLTM